MRSPPPAIRARRSTRPSRSAFSASTPPTSAALPARAIRLGSIGDLVAFKIHKVTPDYIASFARIGHRNLPADKLVAMRIFNVTPEDVRALDAGSVASTSQRMRLRLAGSRARKPPAWRLTRHERRASAGRDGSGVGRSALAPACRRATKSDLLGDCSMYSLRNHRLALLAGISLALPQLALAAGRARAVATRPSRRRPSPQRSATGASTRPADFARFSPKTAYDMLVQVPGFTLRGADQERGLGQASENVLINGQRIANKSGGAISELQKVCATNVERIEIVEAASLGIAGLSGQVANVIVKTGQKKASGQFEYEPEIRAYYAKPRLLSGSASYSGTSGPVDYTFAIKNDSGRGAFGGPIRLYDANGVNFENREEILHNEFEQASMSAKFKLDGPGSSIGNLTLSYTPYWGPGFREDRRVRLDGNDRGRRDRNRARRLVLQRQRRLSNSPSARAG